MWRHQSSDSRDLRLPGNIGEDTRDVICDDATRAREKIWVDFRDQVLEGAEREVALEFQHLKIRASVEETRASPS